jgi:hypothetical protein
MIKATIVEAKRPALSARSQGRENFTTRMDDAYAPVENTAACPRESMPLYPKSKLKLVANMAMMKI